MYQGSHATLNTSKNAKLRTDRCPDRCAILCPGRNASRFLYPRLSIDLRLAVLLLLSRCVLKYQRRLVTTINVYING